MVDSNNMTDNNFSAFNPKPRPDIAEIEALADAASEILRPKSTRHNFTTEDEVAEACGLPLNDPAVPLVAGLLDARGDILVERMNTADRIFGHVAVLKTDETDAHFSSGQLSDLIRAFTDDAPDGYSNEDVRRWIEWCVRVRRDLALLNKDEPIDDRVKKVILNETLLNRVLAGTFGVYAFRGKWDFYWNGAGIH